MKTWKLVSGILNCVFFVFIAFQSCAATMIESISEEKGTSGGAGLIVAILLLVGGIVSIVTRKARTIPPNLVLMIVYILSGFIARSGASGIYKDLMVWSFWSFICAVPAIILIAQARKPKT